MELEADACVIGTGAGGAVLAAELAEAGHSVIMLEKGGHFTRKDFTQKEQEMMPRLFEEGGARTTADGGIMVLHGSSVGGGTTVNWAICFDPPGHVLDEWADAHGVEGIRLADMKPHLAKVRHILNVQKMKPDEVTENGRLLLEGAKKLGMHADRFEHNRTMCVRSGFCILGCAYDRKQGMNVTYVPRALHFGAQLYPRAEVTAFEREGDRIVAVRGVLTDPETGAQHKFRVKAKLFSVSGGAISTPALLRKNQLGNDQVGQNLTIHPTTAAVAIFDHEVKAWDGIHYGTYVTDLEPEGIIIESVFAYPGLMGSALFAWGDRAMEKMAAYNRMAAAIVLLHDDGRGTVEVDRYGLPVVQYWVSEKDQQKFRKGLKTVARIFLAAGAKEVLIPHASALTIRSEADLELIDRMPIEPNRMAVFTAHQMGTAAMGKDPTTSVTDAWGRVHGMDNLFVCDGSLMPTSIGVNPQITIAALATRTAGHIIQEKKRYFG
jgi:choline dehydrogenase-like flavoprotein